MLYVLFVITALSVYIGNICKYVSASWLEILQLASRLFSSVDLGSVASDLIFVTLTG